MRPFIKADNAVREGLICAAVASGKLIIDHSGRIWKRRVHGLIRAENPGGPYLQIRVTVNGRRIFAMAHRIVYRHFVGPIPEGLTINHKDGQKRNNIPRNLEPATSKEQHAHAVRVLGRHRRIREGQRGTDHLMARLSEADVFAIRRARALGVTLVTLARKFGVSGQHISSIALGHSWKHLPLIEDGTE